MTVGMLLGPQRLHPIVGEALEILKVDPSDGRKIAAITAGWQKREAEDQELCAALGNRSVNLMLHARGEAVFRDDPDFFAAHRAKQDPLRSLQDLYRLRLARTLKAARRVQQASAPRDLIESELEEALQALRMLDAHHVTKVRQIEEVRAPHQAAPAPVGAPPAGRDRRDPGRLQRRGDRRRPRRGALQPHANVRPPPPPRPPPRGPDHGLVGRRDGRLYCGNDCNVKDSYCAPHKALAYRPVTVSA